jgi:hypothetical protein
MADYNFITSLGVVQPDTATLRDQVVSEWREAFGADLVTDPETPQGVMITAETEARDAVARNNAELANQINPDIAEGVFLDAIWALTRGSRRGATRSLITGAVLGGASGTIVPAGSLASVDGTNDLFQTTGDVTIGVGGTVTANLESVETGPIPCPIGQLVNVATAVLGWETITNPSAAVLGRNEESDISARRRRRNTLALQGVALPEAIISRVYDVDEVRSVVFRENVTSSPQIIDGVNMIPHSIFVGVSGGDDDAIAYALLSTKSLGAGWNGNTTVDVVEPASGTTYSVQFDRPVAVNVYVKVTARYNGIDAATVVPDAIHKYADGELDNEDGFVIGADVNPFEIAGAINQVEPRIFVTNVELSTDGVTFAPTAVPISIQQIATLATIQVIPV